MTVSIIGSIAFDTIKSPVGSGERLLGGAATYAGVAASIFTPVSIIGVVGQDFPEEHFDFFKSRNIDASSVERSSGKTFHWEGFYEGDMNQAHTVKTELNVLMEFEPKIQDHQKDHNIVYLANIDPVIQRKALQQFRNPELVLMDTMNFWIDSKLDDLKETIKQVDVLIINDQEARLLTGIDNLIKALPEIIKLGPKRVIIKKGEHGAIMYNGKTYFMCPAYPLENLADPTGAGDSFAGAIAGYLAHSETIDDEAFKRAVIIGTLVSSFTVQGFSLDRLKTLNWDMLEAKYEEMKGFIGLPESLRKLPVL